MFTAPHPSDESQRVHHVSQERFHKLVNIVLEHLEQSDRFTTPREKTDNPILRLYV